MSKRKSIVISTRVDPMRMAAVLRYYRTKLKNPPRTKGSLIGRIVDDFYLSLQSAHLLVPFKTLEEAKDYLMVNQSSEPENEIDKVKIIHEGVKTGSLPSENSRANELLEGLERAKD